MAPALLAAVDCSQHIHLIIGSNPLAGARCTRSLEVGAIPKLIAAQDSVAHYGLHKRVDEGHLQWLQREFRDEDLTTLGRSEVDYVVDAVFVTLGPRNPLSVHISHLCRRLRIPVNVSDSPSLSTFTLLSTYNDGPIQIGVTTSGKGCKLAARIHREISSTLPSGLGGAVDKLGALRRQFQEEDAKRNKYHTDELEVEDDDSPQAATFNQLVNPDDEEQAKTRRLRWLSQICEYWPLKRLAAVSEDDIASILASYRANADHPHSDPATFSPERRKGYIILAGSGPGSPELLTGATLTALQTADVVLADKLVPAPVLDLIPRRTTVHIARKFPGNAEAAQDELMRLGLEGVRAGKTVLRLKQGDPYLFGRGGEEVVYFRKHGYEAIVLPGITSALSAPLFAGVPVTQRAVADQVLICTGTGRAGKAPVPPEYVESRTVVFLMALHRLGALVESLTGTVVAPEAKMVVVNGKSDGHLNGEINGHTNGYTNGHINGLTNGQVHGDTQVNGAVKPNTFDSRLWPITTPCAIVERASCRDQRVIRSTLEHVCAAVEELGSLPPGLLIVGNACVALQGLKGRWEVEEGFQDLTNPPWLGDGVGSLGVDLGLGVEV